MMANKSPITREGKQKIERELEGLIKGERETLKKRIQEAREHGDLKENAEYHAAKEKQSLVEGRIAKLQHVLATSEVVDIANRTGQTIVFGASVQLINIENNETVTYTIVGEAETDVSQGRISYKGPLGAALIGKEEGDIITVKAPKGDIEYEVQSISFGP